MRRLRCWFRRHEWHSEYHHEDRRVVWECRRCGASKRTGDHIQPEIAAAAEPSAVGDQGGVDLLVLLGASSVVRLAPGHRLHRAAGGQR